MFEIWTFGLAIVAITVSVITLTYNLLTKRPFVFVKAVSVDLRGDRVPLSLIVKNCGEKLGKSLKISYELNPTDDCIAAFQPGLVEHVSKLFEENRGQFVLFPNIEEKHNFFLVEDNDAGEIAILRFYVLKLKVKYKRNKLWPLFCSYQTLQEFQFSEDRYVQVSSYVKHVR